MYRLSRHLMVLSLVLLVGSVIFATAETRRGKPSVKRSGRLLKNISRKLDASNKPCPSRLLKLNQSELVLPGKAGVIRVQLRQSIYRGELTTLRGEPLEDEYVIVSTLQPRLTEASYSFSFCSPQDMFLTPHDFRLFSHGAGKNYLVWTQQRFIFLAEISKGNDLPETLIRKMVFYDDKREEAKKAVVNQLLRNKVQISDQDFLWRIHASRFVAQDFGLTTMPEIVNVPALITNDEYGNSRNSIQEEMFVISMSAPKQDSLSLQFVTPKMDVIYTASKKDGKWRITGKEPLTAKKAKELAPLLRG